MRYLLVFMLLVVLFGCTTTYNTKINSENTILIEKVTPVVLIRNPHNPYKKSEK